MELIDQMVGAQNTLVVGYAEFLQRFVLGDNSLHFFCEGNEDRIYYHAVMRSLHPGVPATPYRCGDKDGVLVVFGLITGKSEYADARTLFFVDRDFDALISNPSIYETPFYSIENFYTQEHCLTEFLTGNLGILPGSADFIHAVNLFRQTKEQFFDLCRPVNAYLRCIAAKRAAGLTPRLNINSKINFKEGVAITVDRFHLNGIPSDLPGMETLFGTPGVVSQAEFDREITLIRGENLGQIGRGKFEMQFVIHFFQRFKAGLVNKKLQVLGALYKCRVNVDPDTFVNDFYPYAIVPDCLRQYIRRA